LLLLLLHELSAAGMLAETGGVGRIPIQLLGVVVLL